MNKKKQAELQSKKSRSDPEQKPVPISISNIVKSAWFLPFISLFLLIIVLSFRKIANFDVGFHLASGRWIIENLAFPYKDIFTYTVSGNEYIDVLWLYQVIFYLVQSISGYGGLTILNSLLILIVFYLVFIRLNLAGTPFYISFPALLAAVFAIQIRFSYRPEIVTWIFILLALYILDIYLQSGKNKLYWLPVIMLFWVNMHGLFVIGLLIIAVYLISIYYHSAKIDKDLLKWFGISIGAVFVNPYFIDGALFPFYLFTRLEAGNIFKDTISELQSPWSMSGSVDTDLYIYYSITIVSAIIFVLTYKKRKLHQYLFYAAFFYISYRAFRNIPIFIIYALHISALGLSEIVKYKNFKKYFVWLSGRKRIISILFSIVVLLVAVRVLTGAFYWQYNSRLQFGAGLNNTALPEKTSNFLNEKGYGGKLLNVLEYGGWLEWRTRKPVFVDGRLEVMKEAFYGEYINGTKTNGLGMLINKYNPDVIVNDVGNYVWNLELKKRSDWQLVYFDNTSSVFIKKTGGDSVNFDFLAAIRSEGVNIAGFNDNSRMNLIKDVRIYSLSDWISGFYNSQYMPVELLKMGNFAFDFQRADVAELFYLEFLKRSGGLIGETNYFDVFNNLAAVYTIAKAYNFAVMCYENCLKVKPADQSIRAKIAELKKLIK